LIARAAAISFGVLDLRGGRGGLSLVEAVFSAGSATSKPVMIAVDLRTNLDRQRMVRVTRAGLECQLNITVPRKRMTRFVVMIYRGGRVRRIQTGVTSNIRINRVVSAGRVVAEVAVRCVDRKSVNLKNGSSKMLHLDVKSFSVSTISSRLLCCRINSESPLLCPFCTFSPVVAVEDKGEYLREYMPRIKTVTTTTGPTHRITVSP
jgi:hypothetical protein